MKTEEQQGPGFLRPGGAGVGKKGAHLPHSPLCLEAATCQWDGPAWNPESRSMCQPCTPSWNSPASITVCQARASRPGAAPLPWAKQNPLPGTQDRGRAAQRI